MQASENKQGNMINTDVSRQIKRWKIKLMIKFNFTYTLRSMSFCWWRTLAFEEATKITNHNQHI